MKNLYEIWKCGALIRLICIVRFLINYCSNDMLCMFLEFLQFCFNIQVSSHYYIWGLHNTYLNALVNV